MYKRQDLGGDLLDVGAVGDDTGCGQCFFVQSVVGKDLLGVLAHGHIGKDSSLEAAQACLLYTSSATLKVTSGVISRGAKPVPPVVRIRFT